MPRNAPHNNTPSPAICTWRWKGGDGKLIWYDKNAADGKGENVEEALPFTFLLLDRVAAVTGFNEPKESGLFSNEVKDTLVQPFVVRFQKKGLGTLVEGVWQDIKDKVKANGGKYAINCYVAFRDPGDKVLKIGKIQMSGCALGPWIEFEQESGNALYSKAVVMSVGEEVTKGTGKRAIVYNPPAFELKDTKKETDDEAGELQKLVADYFANYFAKPTIARPEVSKPASEHEEPPQRGGEPEPDEPPTEGDDVPF